MILSPTFLITFPYTIGDIVQVASSCADEIIASYPGAQPAIDILCNEKQSELVSLDPRFRQVIVLDRNLFPMGERKSWIYVLLPHPKSVKIAHNLRGQNYDYVYPGSLSFGFLLIVGGRMMLPRLKYMRRYW